MVGMLIAIVAPPFFLVSSVWLLVGATFATAKVLPRETTTLFQQLTQCSYSSGKIHLTGALRLEGPSAVAVSPDQFAVLLEDPELVVSF